MINILSNEQEDILVDVMRESNNGHSPTTFGDCALDSNGLEYPLETELVKEEDYCTQ